MMPSAKPIHRPPTTIRPTKNMRRLDRDFAEAAG
jgi:hypothetical protein